MYLICLTDSTHLESNRTFYLALVPGRVSSHVAVPYAAVADPLDVVRVNCQAIPKTECPTLLLESRKSNLRNNSGGTIPSFFCKRSPTDKCPRIAHSDLEQTSLARQRKSAEDSLLN